MSPVVTHGAIDLAAVLRAAGCQVEEVLGWETRGHPGTFAPVGVLWHHTAGLNAIDTVVNGRPDLAGPLCNLYLDREGMFHVVAAGVAWHAGPGSQTVLDEIMADQPHGDDAAARGLPDDCSIGNERLYGIEVEALGDGDPSDYPQVQIDALEVGTAAILRAQSWAATRCRHHREWTARKQDMSYQGDLWGAVTAQLEGTDMPLSAADLTKIAALIKASQDVTITHIRDDKVNGIAALKAELDAVKAKVGA